MNKKFLKSLAPVFVGLLLAASLTSCNRGVGCPNNFSLTKVVMSIIK